jgi:MFS family permease
MLVTVLTVKEQPGTGRSAPFNFSIIFESFRISLKGNPGFVFFLVSRLLFMMALTTLQSFALYYFQDMAAFTNPIEVTANMITIVGITMLIVVYPAGKYSDKIGRKPILLGCGLLAAAGIALIFFFHSYNWILFAGVLIGISAGAFLSTNWALATDLIPREEAARYLGIANLASAGGGALARLIGPVIDFFNRIADGMGYSVMLGACFVYFIISAVLIWQIRTPTKY